MDKKGLMMLKVLINQYNPKAGFSLLKFLPQENANEIENFPIDSSDLNPILNQPYAYIKKLHHSWLNPILEKASPDFLPYIYGILTQEQLQGLQPKVSPASLSDPVKTFFIDHFYSLFEDTDHLPIDYLPNTPLKPLLDWNKEKLVQLGDFLGLHDLASEVKTIVNKTHLKNIYSCLTPKQFNFLKTCLQKKERVSVPKLPFDPSKQDCQKLKLILHQRGLARLGKAICGEHPDFVWYLAHVLDSVRGKQLLNTYTPEPQGKVTEYLKAQVVNLINYLKDE